MTTTPEPATSRLVQLGFSTYEARTYVGLLTTGPATGYAVANATGVPQPKVYETLRRLADRGAAVQIAGQPARWSAIPPDALLASLDSDFAERLGAARDDLAELAATGSPTEPSVLWRQTDRAEILENARRFLRGATTHVYLSGQGSTLGELADDITAAAAREVEFTVLHFGDLPFPAPRGRSFRHATTDAVLRPSVRALHLAMVIDSQQALWAVARDGHHWEGLNAEDALLAGVVKSYVRHDIFVQRMYAELPEELEQHFGPGLLQLADLTGTAADESTAEDRTA
jgi:HTH-type transcriptional regulator, sugar sensing transcriptional regulator